MLESQLREVLRRVLWTSIAAPVAMGLGGCGGAVSGRAGGNADGGEGDSGRHVGADSGCVMGACGIDCPSETVLSESCVDGVAKCTCIPVGPPPFEGGAPDAAERDANVDAGDLCHPKDIGCGVGATIPGSCFDGGLSADAAVTYTQEQCTALCGPMSSITGCNVVDTPAGPGLDCYIGCLGRRPPGMRASRARGPRIGRYFAAAAHLEAASVDAFEVLRNELEAHGAPADLLVAAEEARRDEVRHARMTARLARRYGARPVKPRVRRIPVRSLEALAIENAVEGCVRETVGALMAMHQATAASDPHVRAVMASIAPDETRHAALGWAVAAWADRQLTPEARVRVRRAQEDAVMCLKVEIARAAPADLADVVGLPGPAVARRMLDALEASLWNVSKSPWRPRRVAREAGTHRPSATLENTRNSVAHGLLKGPSTGRTCHA